MSQPDAVIIGGGFAGVTAARELTMRGRIAVLVEARDRLGGRTYTVPHDGHELELGGTWVHPLQPNVWAEITRYGLDVVDFPVPGARQAVVSGGRVVDLNDDGMAQMLDAIARFSAPGAALFAKPFSEHWGPDSERYDDRTLREYLTSKPLPPLIRDAVDAMFSLIAFSPLDRASVIELLRTFALSSCSAEHMLAALTAVKLKSGTRVLIDAIASQAKNTDIQFQSPVRRIAQTGDRVEVELRNGKTIAAKTAVITLPLNVLGSVEFEPQLSDIKRAATAEGHTGCGVKCYVHVKGDVGNVSVYAPSSEAVNWAVTYKHTPKGSLLNVFGADPQRLAIDDVAGMQAALRRLLPGVEVESIFGWDWNADPFALGAWCIYRPGQLTRFLPELRRTEGRLFFASADSAVAWRSFIDGAIESGYRAAREIDGFLSD